ncbi:MAG: ATP-binding protein [Clostridia bacterium]|nr:ATP-binding protein [Clostridia bacterium]
MWIEVKTVVDLKNATQELCRRLEERSIPKEKVFDCRLVVNELVGNVLRHSDGTASVKGVIEPDRIEIFVRSTKVFFPPNESILPPASAESGRGLYLIDSVSVSRTVTPDGEIKVTVKY